QVGDQFGSSVAIGGGTPMVGAPGGRRVTTPRLPLGSGFLFSGNTPPLVSAARVAPAQGLPASLRPTPPGHAAPHALATPALTVNGAASATVNGVTVSSISVDASGQVTASVGADCGASDASFTLRVTDSGGLFAEDTLNVTVTRTQLTALGLAKVWVGLKNSD